MVVDTCNQMGLYNNVRETKPLGMQASNNLVPVPSQDKFGGLCQEGHPA